MCKLKVKCEPNLSKQVDVVTVDRRLTTIIFCDAIKRIANLKQNQHIGGEKYGILLFLIGIC